MRKLLAVSVLVGTLLAAQAVSAAAPPCTGTLHPGQRQITPCATPTPHAPRPTPLVTLPPTDTD